MPVRSAIRDDAAAVADIYNFYARNSHSTFEIDPLDSDEILRRMEGVWAAGYPFLVYEDDRGIVGFAYGHPYRQRAAYRYSAEVSVYIRDQHGG